MDRGFVFSLVRTYMKDMAAKMLQAGSIGNDSLQLWKLQVRTILNIVKFYVQQSLHKSLYISTMVSLQIDFSRILCSHEHFVALNLPSHNPQQQLLSEPGNFYSGASSPTLSVRSTDSQSSFVSHGMYQATNTINRR